MHYYEIWWVLSLSLAVQYPGCHSYTSCCQLLISLIDLTHIWPVPPTGKHELCIALQSRFFARWPGSRCSTLLSGPRKKRTLMGRCQALKWTGHLCSPTTYGGKTYGVQVHCKATSKWWTSQASVQIYTCSPRYIICWIRVIYIYIYNHIV